MYKQCGNTQFGEMFSSKLRRLAGWMQRIGKQQESVSDTWVFGGNHAGLPAAVGLSGEIQDFRSELTQFLRSLDDAFSIALAGTTGGATRSQLSERQVPAQHAVSGIGESLGYRDHQRSLAIAARSVRQKHRGFDLGRLMQPALDTGFFKSLRQGYLPAYPRD